MKSKVFDGPLISVIVPIYNSSQTLKRCINSIISQTYPNLEIILVDDGSTDDSLEICHEYSSMKNVIIIHKKNGGAAEARNEGLKAASGDYCGFVDSDDYVLPMAYEKLMSNLIKNSADVSICDRIVNHRDNSLHLKQSNTDVCIITMDRLEAVKHLDAMDLFDMSPCNKLYKIELFRKIQFAAGKSSEDTRIMYRLLLLCKKVVFSSEKLYVYCKNANSISSSKESVLQYIEASREQVRYMKKYHENLIDDAKTLFTFSNIVLFNVACLDGAGGNYSIDEKKNSLKCVRKGKKVYLRNRLVPCSRKLQLICICYFPHIYNVIIRLKHRH